LYTAVSASGAEGFDYTIDGITRNYTPDDILLMAEGKFTALQVVDYNGEYYIPLSLYPEAAGVPHGDVLTKEGTDYVRAVAAGGVRGAVYANQFNSLAPNDILYFDSVVAAESDLPGYLETLKSDMSRSCDLLERELTENRETFSGGRFAALPTEAIDGALNEIRTGIANAQNAQIMGRYVIFYDAPYTTLLDITTLEAYGFYRGDGKAELRRMNWDSPDTFLHGYLVGRDALP
jgi:hypothetical protein